MIYFLKFTSGFQPKEFKNDTSALFNILSDSSANCSFVSILKYCSISVSLCISPVPISITSPNGTILSVEDIKVFIAEHTSST